MEASEMHRVVTAFLVERFLYGQGSVDVDESLFTGGVLDSLRVIRLMAFLEERFEIRIGRREIDLERFDTVRQIVALVQARKAEDAAERQER